ncbi:hypothetical protein BC832DRAFT_563403 [Gaertneriomyces semiglobifer]|nr:hypothetical protein BC832DRAFT_563403 [Gaertneriomyces semiglobifer]
MLDDEFFLRSDSPPLVPEVVERVPSIMERVEAAEVDQSAVPDRIPSPPPRVERPPRTDSLADPHRSSLPSEEPVRPPKNMMLRRQHSRGAIIGIPASPVSPRTCSPIPELPRTQSLPSTMSLSMLPAAVIFRIVTFLPSPVERLACALTARTLLLPSLHALYYSPPIESATQFHLFIQALLQPSHLPYAAYVQTVRIRRGIADQILMGDLDILLQVCQGLKCMEIEQGGTGNIVVQSLSDNARMLQRLILRGCPVTDALMPLLVRSCAKLSHVDFSFTGVTVGTLITLIEGCENIQDIQLESCTLGYVSIALDPRLNYTRTLRTLNLRNSGVLDAHLVHLSRSCPYLTTLILDGCVGVTDTGIVSVSQSCHRIQLLDLSFTSISDLSLVAISQYLKCLERLHLSGTGITSDGVVEVAKGCAAIKEITLHGCVSVINSWAGQYASRGGAKGVECVLRHPALQWVAKHKEVEQEDVVQKAVVKRLSILQSKSAVATEASSSAEHVECGTQTEKQESIGEDTSNGGSTPSNQTSADATEILLKFADAIASGRWVPPNALPQPPTVMASHARHSFLGHSHPHPAQTSLPPHPSSVPVHPSHYAAYVPMGGMVGTVGFAYGEPPAYPGAYPAYVGQHPHQPFAAAAETHATSPQRMRRPRDSAFSSTSSIVTGASEWLRRQSSCDGGDTLVEDTDTEQRMLSMSPSPVTSTPPTPAPATPTSARVAAVSLGKQNGLSGLRMPTPVSRLARPTPVKSSSSSSLLAGMTVPTKSALGSSTSSRTLSKKDSVRSLSSQVSLASTKSLPVKATSKLASTAGYKPRTFRRFSQSPEEAAISLSRPKTVVPAPTRSQTAPGPVPRIPTTPRRGSLSKNAGNDREQTKKLLSGVKRGMERTRWSHHLQPSEERDGWIVGGTMAEDGSPGKLEREAEDAIIGKEKTKAALLTTPVKKLGAMSGLKPPTPINVASKLGMTGLKPPTPVRRIQ